MQRSETASTTTSVQTVEDALDPDPDDLPDLDEDLNPSEASFSVAPIPPPTPSVMRIYEPLNHCDYDIIDAECSCSVCQEWRSSLTAFLPLYNGTIKHERNCRCPECRAKMKARSLYIAAFNRRDLYSESSFHAMHMEPEIGTKFMSWLQGILHDRKLVTEGWWEKRGSQIPVWQWQALYKQADAAGVSGFAYGRSIQ